MFKQKTAYGIRLSRVGSEDVYKGQACHPSLMAIDMAIQLFLVAWHTSLIPKAFVRTVLGNILSHGKAPAAEGPIAAFVKTIRLIGWDVGDRLFYSSDAYDEGDS